VRELGSTTEGGAGTDSGAAPALQLDGIHKRFGEQVALAGVDFDLQPREVHALLGENGAGKTTLMNIATGIVKADAGTISVGGERVSIASPRDAAAHGLGMVHQHYRLVPRMTVAENLHVGWADAPRMVSGRQLVERATELGERFGIHVDPDAPVSTLSAGESQRVAILRALSRGARVLILDEPTAVLTPIEADRLFESLRAMAAEGHSIVFISHKLYEVMAVADRVSVLRGGVLVARLPRSECEISELARLTVGSDLPDRRPPSSRKRGAAILRARGLRADVGPGERPLHDLDFDVHRSELLGIAGVSGNGQVELAQVLTGQRDVTEGALEVLAGDAAEPADAARVGHIPEHHAIGLALAESLEFNSVLRVVDSPTMRRGPVLRRSRLKQFSAGLLSRAGLGRVAARRPVATLSGGQMQRLLVHRELAAGSSTIVAVHPTRGLDVAAARRVQDLLLEARDGGAGVVLISEDLDEVLEVCDRLLVLYEGAIVGRFDRPDFDRDSIGLLMGGAGLDAGEPATAAGDAA
jgi:general nucleoside transport system ATP-binding protein